MEITRDYESYRARTSNKYSFEPKDLVRKLLIGAATVGLIASASAKTINYLMDHSEEIRESYNSNIRQEEKFKVYQAN